MTTCSRARPALTQCKREELGHTQEKKSSTCTVYVFTRM